MLLRKFTGQMVLVCLSCGILGAANKPEIKGEAIVAQAQPQGDQSQAAVRESVLANIRNVTKESKEPPQENERRVAGAMEMYDASIAKGYDPATSANLAYGAFRTSIAQLDGFVSASKSVLNSVDLSQTPIDSTMKGQILAQLSNAQMRGASPDKVQEISNALVDMAPDMSKIMTTDKNFGDLLMDTMTVTMSNGLPVGEAQQRRDQIIEIAGQLDAKGYTGKDRETGIQIAASALTANATPDQSQRAGEVGAAASRSGASPIEIQSVRANIIDAVKAGVPDQQMNDIVNNGLQVNRQVVDTTGSTTAGIIGADTTGTGTLQGMGSPQSIDKGLQAGQMGGQIVNQFGDRAGAAAGNTITRGTLNGSPNTMDAATFAAETANRLQGASSTVINGASDVGGQAILNNQPPEIAQQAVNVAAQAMINAEANNIGGTGTEMAGKTAADVFFAQGTGSQPAQQPLEGGAPVVEAPQVEQPAAVPPPTLENPNPSVQPPVPPEVPPGNTA